MEDWMYDLPLETQRQMEEDYFRDDCGEDKEIKICNYVVGSCTDCPFYDKCTMSFETDRSRKEWIGIINDLIFDLEEIKKSIINE